MRSRFALRSTPLLLTAVWAACADTPVEPSIDRAAVTAAAPSAAVGPVVSDAAALQAALDEVASGAAPSSTIVVSGPILLDAPLVYQGDRDLTLLGRGARIVGPVDPIAAPSNSGARVGEETVGDALQILGGPDLTIENVRFEGQSGHGIYVEFLATTTGTVAITLTGVTFEGQGLSALWVEDQKGGAEAAPETIESPASIHLEFDRVTVRGTGFAEDAARSCRGLDEDAGCSWADFDGVRVNEGGDGDITFAFRTVEFTGNAGDGIEFDETGAGAVDGSVLNGSFDRNGDQPQFPVDLEDGFDIDEAGPGGIALRMERVSILSNIDEGLDLDEEGTGDVVVTLVRVNASGNADDNVKISEDADLEDEAPAGATGGIVVDFTQLTANGALDGDGVNLEEFGEGRITGTIELSQIRRNADDGLQAEQVDAGSDTDGLLTLIRSQVKGNGDDDLNPDNVIIH